MNIENIQILSLGWNLRYLVGRCETRCVSECCGLDAFDFSPLNIAYYFSDQGEIKITNEAVKGIEEDIQKFRQKTFLLVPNENDIVCKVEELDAYCTMLDITNFTDEILQNMQASRQILELSENIRAKENNGKP